MLKKVSIIVPVYNVGDRFVKECINSLIKQTYKNIEILLVDDGSSKKSGAICDYYALLDSRIVVIHGKNGGLSEARRRGIRMASGDYIMIVDADDWIDIDTIDNCMSLLEDHEELKCIIYSYVREYPDHSLAAHVMTGSAVMDADDTERRVYRRLFGLLDDELKHPERLENMGSCCMKLYHKELANQGRFFDIKDVGSSEDILFNMYALYECKNTAYIDKPMYHYRKTGASITSTYRPNLTKQWKTLFHIMNSIIDEKGLDYSYKRALDNRIALSVFGIGMNEITGRGIKRESLRNIRSYIYDDIYRNAIMKIKLKYLPLPWKCLLLFAKYKLTGLLLLELWTIDILRKHF